MNTIYDSQAGQNAVTNSKLNSLKNTGTLEVKKNLSESERAEYAKAARGFESMFVNMLLKEMKSAMLDKKEEGEFTFGASTLGSYVDTLWSDEISNTGQGMGIADKIFSQLTGGQHLRAKTVVPAQLPDGLNFQIKPEIQITKEKSNLNKGNFADRLTGRLEMYSDTIRTASQKYNVPESLIKGVISAESAGRHDAKSPAGAKGLMQLMDATASELGVKNSFDPKENINGGTKYLKKMLDMFDNNKEMALAAYNAGPGNVMKYGGIPPFKETQAYVKKVAKYSKQFSDNSKMIR